MRWSISSWAALMSALCLLVVASRSAGAQCYRFTNSERGDSVTIQIAHLPAPNYFAKSPDGDHYEYNLAEQPGNRVSATLNATIGSGGDTFELEAARDLPFAIDVFAVGPWVTHLRFFARGRGPFGTPMISISLSAPSGLLPNGLPPRLPPVEAWSMGANFAVITTNPKGEPVSTSRQIDVIDDSCGVPPPAKAAGGSR
jgi:hypothetical protein